MMWYSRKSWCLDLGFTIAYSTQLPNFKLKFYIKSGIQSSIRMKWTFIYVSIGIYLCVGLYVLHKGCRIFHLLLFYFQSAVPQKGSEVNLTLGGIDLNNSGRLAFSIPS